jgi:hypothetical protein
MKKYLLTAFLMYQGISLSAQLAPKPEPTKPDAVKLSPQETYVKNYYLSLIEEIKSCERLECKHGLRLLEFNLNAYDTCRVGECGAQKMVKFWYKILPPAKENEAPRLSLLRVDVLDKSAFWENQQFVFEAGKLIYYQFENPMEVGEFLLKDSTVLKKNEFFKEASTKPESKQIFEQYKAAAPQWKRPEVFIAQSKRHMERLQKVCELYLDR